MATAASTGPHLDGSIRSLLGDVLDHVRSLLRLELTLALGDVRRAVVPWRRGAVLLAVASVVGTLGLLSLMAALVGALSTVWPFWLAATAVGIVFSAVGAVLGRMALSGFKIEDIRSSATFESFEETKTWLKSRA